MYSFSADAAGNTYAGTYGGGVLKRYAGGWKRINSSGVGGSSAFYISADRKGKLYAAFSDLNGPAYVGKGVYFTQDTGATWYRVKKDSVTYNLLTSFGDTTYGLAYFNGVDEFTGTALGVESTPFPAQDGSKIYPNPSGGSFHLALSCNLDAPAEIVIYDLQGRTVYRAVVPPGATGSVFDIMMGSAPKGMYIYRLRLPDGLREGKIIIM